MLWGSGCLTTFPQPASGVCLRIDHRFSPLETLGCPSGREKPWETQSASLRAKLAWPYPLGGHNPESAYSTDFSSKFPPSRSPFLHWLSSYHQADPLRLSMLGGCLLSRSSLICSIVFAQAPPPHHGHLCLVIPPRPFVPCIMGTAPLPLVPAHHNHRAVSGRFITGLRRKLEHRSLSTLS